MKHEDLKVGSDGGDWSGTFIWRSKPKAQILVTKYTKQGRSCIKIAGGCCTNNEHPHEALANEITQELDLELVSPEQVHHIWTNEKVPGRHHQHFFATPETNVQGVLREKDMPDGDETLGPPYWMDVEEALRVLFFTHLQGLKRALPIIAQRDSEFCREVVHLMR